MKIRTRKAPVVRIDFEVEAPLSLTLSQLEKLQQIARGTFTTLDAVESMLKMDFNAPGYFVYRGGHHVALILNNKRIALIVERELR